MVPTLMDFRFGRLATKGNQNLFKVVQIRGIRIPPRFSRVLVEAARGDLEVSFSKCFLQVCGSVVPTIQIPEYSLLICYFGGASNIGLATSIRLSETHDR